MIRQHGQTLQAYGRVTARAATIEREYFLGVPGYVIQWTCSDPLRYSAAQESLSLSPPTGEGGLHWEEGLHWEDGLNWGSLVYSSASATNDGTASTSPMVYLHGPLSAPYAVVAPDAGWRLGFDLELAEEETLVVDTRNGTATLGGKNRLYTLSPTSDIPEDCLLPPGSTSLQLSTRDFTDAGSAVVAWRHAYT
ncbi:MAG: hypothetical protein ACRDQA_22925 [Nocardioidaceae bacterium]